MYIIASTSSLFCELRLTNAALRLLASSVGMVDKEIALGRRGHVKVDRCLARVNVQELCVRYLFLMCLYLFEVVLALAPSNILNIF